MGPLVLDTLQQVERNVDDHVFLPANHVTCAQLDEDVDGLEAVLARINLGVPPAALSVR